ncbi:MAG: hypothetical protein R3296_00190 [Oleiphilaceae bacterium]|nr:hypothetical protein [Oleiphilaceae bacterium]
MIVTVDSRLRHRIGHRVPLLCLLLISLFFLSGCPLGGSDSKGREASEPATDVSGNGPPPPVQ